MIETGRSFEVRRFKFQDFTLPASNFALAAPEEL
jgi:hypothetical protein